MMVFWASGEGLSLLAAVAWAAAILFFKRTGDSMPPAALNLFKNMLGLGCLLITLVFVGEPLWQETATEDTALLLTSGVIGIALADTLLFHCLNLLGASRASIVDCLYTPFIVLFSSVLLGEELTWLTGAGTICVCGAILLLGLERSTATVSKATLAEGIVVGVLAMSFMAVGIIMVKPVLAAHSVLWATTMRVIGGTATLGLATLILPRWRLAAIAAFTPAKVWWYAVPGSFCGAYLALIVWVGGMKYTQAITASILNQMSTLLVVLLAAVFLKEALTWPKVAAMILGIAGSALALI
jgi:drug/metabolite transporter (DMT)-like permease